MIVIDADFVLADPSTLEAGMVDATRLQKATRDEEPGCHAYVFSPDPCVPGRVVVFELWEDQASLALHFDHPNYTTMGGHLRGLGLAGATSSKFRVTASEPVYDDTKTPRADFFSADSQAPDEMIVIAGIIDTPDGAARDEILQRSIPFQMATREGEPGCQRYEFTADPVHPGRIAVYELWDNEAALAPHFKHENYFNMGKLLGELPDRTSDNRKYRCDYREPVYDDTPRARADFFTLED